MCKVKILTKQKEDKKTKQNWVDFSDIMQSSWADVDNFSKIKKGSNIESTPIVEKYNIP